MGLPYILHDGGVWLLELIGTLVLPSSEIPCPPFMHYLIKPLWVMPIFRRICNRLNSIPIVAIRELMRRGIPALDFNKTHDRNRRFGMSESKNKALAMQEPFVVEVKRGDTKCYIEHSICNFCKLFRSCFFHGLIWLA